MVSEFVLSGRFDNIELPKKETASLIEDGWKRWSAASFGQ